MTNLLSVVITELLYSDDKESDDDLPLDVIELTETNARMYLYLKNYAPYFIIPSAD